MIVVSYGGGTNSTAMLVGLKDRGERPDHILFADTGGEKPHTYRHIEQMQAWCANVGFPSIVTVRASLPSDRGTLESFCLHHERLPSIAYGFKQCSQQFKRRPIERYLADIGEHTTLIGIDADEPHRAKPYPLTRYPLLEWDWGRDECEEAIKRAGLTQPGKSACFFCPSHKKQDILQLKQQYPDLMERALEMERNAAKNNAGGVKGLGRRFAWGDLIAWDEAQCDLFSDAGTPEMDCGCYDGD
jgi:hypothetical protein